MESALSAVIPVLGILLIIKVLSTPIRWFWKVACHVLCGFACLFLLNLCSAYTGVVFPLTLATAAVSGFRGAPGVRLILVAQYFSL